MCTFFMEFDMEILALAIAVIFFIYVLYYVIYGVKNEEFQELPYKYEELNITETPIEEFTEYYYIGKSCFSLVKFPYTKVYFYEKFLVVNYRGHAQIFEYNKNIMQIKKDFRGSRISILTDLGEAYIFVNKKRADIFNSLLNKTSDNK